MSLTLTYDINVQLHRAEIQILSEWCTLDTLRTEVNK